MASNSQNLSSTHRQPTTRKLRLRPILLKCSPSIFLCSVNVNTAASVKCGQPCSAPMALNLACHLANWQTQFENQDTQSSFAHLAPNWCICTHSQQAFSGFAGATQGKLRNESAFAHTFSVDTPGARPGCQPGHDPTKRAPGRAPACFRRSKAWAKPGKPNTKGPKRSCLPL